jgi:hypothetical protein
MIKTSFKFLLFACLFSIQILAQVPKPGTYVGGDPNDLDEKFLPDKNSILNSSNNSKTNTGNSRESSIHNVIKFNLGLLARSTAAFEWEHPFGKMVSVQGSLGLTYGQDFCQKTFSALFDLGSSQGSRVSLNQLLTNATFASSTAFFGVGAKAYFSADAPEGGYFHFNIRYSGNNLIYNPNVNGNTSVIVSGSPDLSVRNLGFNFIYGYQIVSGNKNVSFVQDLFVGFGFRKTSYTSFQKTQSNNPNQFQTVYMADGATLSAIQPVFMLGYCLGFGW